MFFFYNNKKPRQFNYKPILYNPEKDEFNERVIKIKKEMGVIENNNYKPTIKGEFIKNTDHVRRKISKEGDNNTKSNKMRNTKLIIFLVVLIVLAYFMYFK